MENQKPNTAAALPWYDVRVEAVRKEYTAPVAEAVEEEPTQYTPKQIYDYLDRNIWKQEEAKKAASVIMYKKSDFEFLQCADWKESSPWKEASSNRPKFFLMLINTEAMQVVGDMVPVEI